MSAEELAKVIALLNTMFSVGCCETAACAIHTYDRCLTFGSEVDLIWRRQRITVTTGLYLLLHLSATVYMYTGIVSTVFASCRVSDMVTNMIESCAAVSFHVVTGAFMALRAYAISNRSLPLTFAISLSSLVIPALDVYQICTAIAPVVPSPVDCMVFSAIKTKIERPLFASGEASTMIPEVWLLVATWRHVYMVKTANEAQLEVDTPLTTLNLRDGTVYFVIFFVLQLVNTLLLVTTTSTSPFSVPIANALQTILLSRFYLNLHEANSPQAMLSSGTSQLSDLSFVQVVGSLAGTIAYNTGSPAAEGMDSRSSSDPDTDEELLPSRRAFQSNAPPRSGILP
ncbi:uncharacterized protein B0H18DRAFT_306506 [Fomitopsis serialis]|uniref:uncharacterized protein n=1 Tax=Fomitopsis serialis TaxID=139415 RepID=UPI002007DA18|nr:uncharacterized protein B0H18DRAFT_306506 [Neoantrodia serialis]KAH9927009.1 hypothetical protein B0H18DRAFT_306506 [Neoantrodia serialis]